jgi:hypothetical protein
MMLDPVLFISQSAYNDTRLESRCYLPVSIRECDETKLGRAIDDKVLRKTRDVEHSHGDPEEELGDKVPVRHGMHGVDTERLERELLGQKFPVDGEGVSGERSRSQGKGRKTGDEGG